MLLKRLKKEDGFILKIIVVLLMKQKLMKLDEKWK